MLTVEGFAGLGRGVFRHPASQLVVRNAAGSPVVIVVDHGGSLLVSCAGDDDFEEACRSLASPVDVKVLETNHGP